jgi:glycosyltransferase involved in cell wall biosynthesis
MKVAMIETGGWGGIGHYTFNLCAALADAGVEVSLLTNRKWEMIERPHHFDVDRCFDGNAGYLGNIKALRARLAQRRPDVVHVQSLISTRFDALLWPAVRRRLPLAMTMHNIGSHERIRWDDWTLWRCLATADAVIVHTRQAADVARQRLGAARARLGLPRRARFVLAFGAIRPYKGLDGVIEALPEIRRRHADTRLLIAGPILVGDEAQYRETIRRTDVENAVIFRPGYVPADQVASYFAAADVAVFNYRDITDSGSLRLACDMGTPVVATAVGSFREFLTDGVTARLVEPGDTPALAAALADVLADGEGAARMARAARALAASAWSWADSAKATVSLYDTIARGQA